MYIKNNQISPDRAVGERGQTNNGSNGTSNNPLHYQVVVVEVMFMAISFTNVLILFQHLVPLPLVVAFNVAVNQLVREASQFC